jgi:hypothetical protein
VVALHERGGKAVTVALALDDPADAEALVDPFSDEEQRSTVDVKLELESLGFDGCGCGARDGACRRG